MDKLDSMIFEAINKGHTTSAYIVNYIQYNSKLAPPADYIKQQIWRLVDRGDLVFTADGTFERAYRL